MEIRPTRDLGDIAHLGLTLPEAGQLLARVQQAVGAAQAQGHNVHRTPAMKTAIVAMTKTSCMAVRATSGVTGRPAIASRPRAA